RTNFALLNEAQLVAMSNSLHVFPNLIYKCFVEKSLHFPNLLLSINNLLFLAIYCVWDWVLVL
ncbi:hypothetical protein ACQP3J_29745, partial [Escherichia coli]